jgi:prepilin-type N-terminal cleavage/methylation domain-containing protein
MKMEDKKLESGLTLLEVAVCAAILGIIVMLAYPTLTTGMTAYGNEAASSDLERQARLVVDEIAESLSLAGRDSVSPDYEEPYSGNWVMFQKNEGYSCGAIQWGPTQVIHHEYDLDDAPDGMDNNGNGVVDEGRILWWQDVCTPWDDNVVLTRNVREYLEGEIPNGQDDNGNGLIDERGLCITRSGNVWTIRLSLEKACGDGQTIIRTVETSVRPRN